MKKAYPQLLPLLTQQVQAHNNQASVGSIGVSMTHQCISMTFQGFLMTCQCVSMTCQCISMTHQCVSMMHQYIKPIFLPHVNAYASLATHSSLTCQCINSTCLPCVSNCHMSIHLTCLKFIAAHDSLESGSIGHPMINLGQDVWDIP